MKTRRGVLAVVLAAAVLITASCSSSGDRSEKAAATIDPVAFRQHMRNLWTDHVAWTRLFIVSAVAGLGDTDATAGRLLQNQADIGDAVAGFYGEEAGAQLEALLRDHILIAGDLIAAAKAGDDTTLKAKSTAWYANADEIAAILAGANPAWPVGTLQDMMRGHLDQTLDEATAQLTGDFPPAWPSTTTSPPTSSRWPTPWQTGSSPSSPTGSRRSLADRGGRRV